MNFKVFQKYDFAVMNCYQEIYFLEELQFVCEFWLLLIGKNHAYITLDSALESWCWRICLWQGWYNKQDAFGDIDNNSNLILKFRKYVIAFVAAYGREELRWCWLRDAFYTFPFAILHSSRMVITSKKHLQYISP